MARRCIPALVLSLLTAGCALTTMEPAHKLDAGEVVVQGAIDEPGVLYIPRLSGAVTVGVGGGDLGVHVGTTGFNVNGGATARWYVSDRWGASLQGDILITTFRDTLFSSGDRFGIVSATPRFGYLLNDESEHFYGGFQAMVIQPFGVQSGTDFVSTNRPGFAAGGYIGLAWDMRGDVDIQLELSAAPVGLFSEVSSGNPGYLVTPTPIAQIGLAVQYRAEEERAAPRPTPDREREDKIY